VDLVRYLDDHVLVIEDQLFATLTLTSLGHTPV
jgi:hypothetical protein